MTRITGHRGARNLWAENSLTGFAEVRKLGVDAVEFDVHLTDAGELVVIHDATLERTTEAAGEVRALTPEARVATKLKESDDVIPTLDEVLDVLGPQGVALHVEIKLDARGRPYPGIVAKVAETLMARGVASRTHLTSFDLGILFDCRQHAPEIRRVVSADAHWVANHGGLKGFIYAVSDLVDIVALRHDFLAANWDEVQRLWPIERLCAWTVNDQDTLRTWLDRGIGHLTSDRPDMALALRKAVVA
ncbi:glycerophosphodiester phosphodiesterase family protein [Salipiger sp. PrR003]|uniref:glycerophosphodiester phosphodiesterase family protein n=1 Tax=Salipiger sp. PrR003 TaxID=2706776 RepID=UPI0013DC363A|nr:glycerophosphodiester phosphodiesterase family protein [Salipiger sp. PrR003]NDV51499.1 glycerophosphodiester phosphodiesterase [Salipiger sp. PrR003]